MAKIKLGVCAKPEYAKDLARIGYDYIECAFSYLQALPDAAFLEAEQAIASSGLQMEAANGMMPAHIKTTGPDADLHAIKAYLHAAFTRASCLGARVVIFGSGASRQPPKGFPMRQAWRQLAEFLKLSGDIGDQYGIDIAIEPLRRAECGILNFVSEGTLMSSLLMHPRVGVLGDTYHMGAGHEPLEAFVQAGTQLMHVHLCHSMGDESVRIFPRPGDGEDYRELFEALHRAGYARCASIEGGTEDLVRDAEAAFALLDAARAG